jgi:hypothetical protein
MLCSKCGAELNDGAIFCQKCGTKVEIKDSAVESVKTAASQPQNDASKNVKPVHKKIGWSWKKKLIIGVPIIVLLLLGCVEYVKVAYFGYVSIPQKLSMYYKLKSSEYISTTGSKITPEGLSNLKKAAWFGDADAMAEIFRIYFFGYLEGGSKDPEEAMRWFEKFAEYVSEKPRFRYPYPSRAEYYASTYPHGSAYLAVGDYYAEGLWGVAKDFKKAKIWYEKALAKGNEEARARIDKLLEKTDEEFVELCGEGSLKEIEAALKAGANPNARGKDDFTPLLEAIENQNSEAVSLLIKNGADVNAKVGPEGLIKGTPLMFASALELNDIVEILLQNGANKDDLDTMEYFLLKEALTGSQDSDEASKIAFELNSLCTPVWKIGLREATNKSWDEFKNLVNTPNSIKNLFGKYFNNPDEIDKEFSLYAVEVQGQKKILIGYDLSKKSQALRQAIEDMDIRFVDEKGQPYSGGDIVYTVGYNVPSDALNLSEENTQQASENSKVAVNQAEPQKEYPFGSVERQQTDAEALLIKALKKMGRLSDPQEFIERIDDKPLTINGEKCWQFETHFPNSDEAIADGGVSRVLSGKYAASDSGRIYDLLASGSEYVLLGAEGNQNSGDNAVTAVPSTSNEADLKFAKLTGDKINVRNAANTKGNVLFQVSQSNEDWLIIERTPVKDSSGQNWYKIIYRFSHEIDEFDRLETPAYVIEKFLKIEPLTIETRDEFGLYSDKERNDLGIW